eukprot:12076842-Alexandrium_andersonii.AAC.1
MLPRTAKSSAFPQRAQNGAHIWLSRKALQTTSASALPTTLRMAHLARGLQTNRRAARVLLVRLRVSRTSVLCGEMAN